MRRPELAGDEDARRAEALLSPDELARMARFRFAADRRRYLFAHALVRVSLSRCAPDTPPERWRFVPAAYGRPELAPEIVAQGAPPLRFNLSHTAGLVACAVAWDRDVGVDVEHLHPPRGDFGVEIAAHHFAPAEVAALAADAPEAQRERFFAFWTLKEAYIKARGLGLAIPLADFAFSLDARAEGASSPDIRVAFAASLGDDPARWWFERRHPTPEHALALALRTQPGELVRTQIEELPTDVLAPH